MKKRSESREGHENTAVKLDAAALRMPCISLSKITF